MCDWRSRAIWNRDCRLWRPRFRLCCASNIASSIALSILRIPLCQRPCGQVDCNWRILQARVCKGPCSCSPWSDVSQRSSHTGTVFCKAQRPGPALRIYGTVSLAYMAWSGGPGGAGPGYRFRSSGDFLVLLVEIRVYPFICQDYNHSLPRRQTHILFRLNKALRIELRCRFGWTSHRDWLGLLDSVFCN